MIATKLHKGQGLGNQLWCYAVTRSIALDRNFDFGILNKDNFWGRNFMEVDFGQVPKEKLGFYQEKVILHENGADITTLDESLLNVSDDTEISGVMQDERYIIKHKEEIKDWFRVKNECDCKDFSNENICIINFRGGEYARHPETFLAEKYWENAVANMRRINPDFRFVVITDDPREAKRFFQNFEVHHFNIGKDYAIIKNAHYLIMSNSSFAWFPAWTSETLKYCIAPKYWARHNVSDGYWSTGYAITSGWLYQDRNGILYDSISCKTELEKYNSGEYLDRTPKYYPAENFWNNLTIKLKRFVPINIRMFIRKFLYENRK